MEKKKKSHDFSLLFTSSQTEQAKERSGLKFFPTGRKQAHPLLCHGMKSFPSQCSSETQADGCRCKGPCLHEGSSQGRSGSQTWATYRRTDPSHQHHSYHILLLHFSTDTWCRSASHLLSNSSIPPARLGELEQSRKDFNRMEN